MKRILSMFLVLCMVMTMLSIPVAFASEEGVIVEGTGYTYDRGEKKELTITSNAGATYSSGWRDDTVYTIGSENVTINILEEVKSIIIGDGVTQIGENVIYSIPNLTSVYLGKNVAQVAPVNFSVFISCPSLESVTVDNLF
ncbi:MAG: hypothetical protein GX386_00570 [Clostridiaceae bacterium]|jgi:hypothetical protein|nr:hypothetical protein [Clostridiaceae bacterium]